MSVAIIDYGSGNLHSAVKAFERAAAALDAPPVIRLTAEPETVAAASRVVLPGVGAFGDCAAGLAAVPGMRDALEHAVRQRAVPFLGICVGMQLMGLRGHEFGVHDGLGWLPGEVRAIAPADPALKVPHMGWNTLDARPHPLLADVPTGPAGWHAYFVHSFALEAGATHTIATAEYGGPITAMVAHGNLAGTQFHPEKSQRLGLTLIANFLRWTP